MTILPGGDLRVDTLVARRVGWLAGKGFLVHGSATDLSLFVWEARCESS